MVVVVVLWWPFFYPFIGFGLFVGKSNAMVDLFLYVCLTVSLGNEAKKGIVWN